MTQSSTRATVGHQYPGQMTHFVHPTHITQYPQYKIGWCPRLLYNKRECSTMSPTCTILPTAATICLAYADWLIVAMLPSYHGSLPYSPYNMCTKPTRPAYTVLTCSWLCSMAIGIQVCFQCNHPRFQWNCVQPNTA